MKKIKEFTSEEMLEKLKKYFVKDGYEISTYSDEYLPVRVPLYCKKEIKEEREEIVIDFTTSGDILT